MVARATQVPDGWRMVRLGDVAEVVMGQSPPGDLVDDWDGTDLKVEGLPFIQGNAEFGPKYPSPLKWCAERFKVSVPGDVLISVRAPVGETNRTNTDIGIGRGLAAVRFSIESQAFGWHILNHSKIALARVAQGSTFLAINGDDLRKLPMPLPPLSEQRAIAAVLDGIDDAIEASESVGMATETLRDSLLHELLTRGVPGWHADWREARGVGTVPASWQVVRLGEVAEVNVSNWDPSDGASILYLDLTAVSAPGVLSPPRELSAADAPSRARRRVASGDILVSTVRPNLRGFARVHDAPRNLIASTGFAVVSANGKSDGSFLYHHVMTRRFSDYLTGASTGQAYPAVRASDVSAFTLPLPPLLEQQAIAAMLDSVDGALENHRRETDALRSLKASSSAALLTGRVRV